MADDEKIISIERPPCPRGRRFGCTGVCGVRMYACNRESGCVKDENDVEHFVKSSETDSRAIRYTSHIRRKTFHYYYTCVVKPHRRIACTPQYRTAARGAANVLLRFLLFLLCFSFHASYSPAKETETACILISFVPRTPRKEFSLSLSLFRLHHGRFPSTPPTVTATAFYVKPIRSVGINTRVHFRNKIRRLFPAKLDDLIFNK